MEDVMEVEEVVVAAGARRRTEGECEYAVVGHGARHPEPHGLSRHGPEGVSSR